MAEPTSASTPASATPSAGPAGLRRDARDNLERLLNEARRLFAENGLAVTLADIAKAARVGVGTVYRRFPDKDELIIAVYRDRMAGGVAKAAEAARADDPAAAFRWFIEQGAADFASDRGFRELVLGGLTESLGWSRSGPPTALTDAVEHMNRTVSGHLTVLIQRAKTAGALRPDIEPTDVQLINAAVQTVAAFADTARPGIHHRMIDLILEGVRTRPDQVSTAPPALTEDELSRAVRTPRPEQTHHKGP